MNNNNNSETYDINAVKKLSSINHDMNEMPKNEDMEELLNNNTDDDDDDNNSEENLPPPLVRLKTGQPKWDITLNRVLPAIVEINTSLHRCFDGNSPALSTASGFVVDANRGIILTNRHVISLGPVTMNAIFPQTQEEVELIPIYRDPIHDFGFCRFEPTSLKFTRVTEISLRPDQARVGEEIRVVGNDAAERLQILSGTIGRLDRQAPDYGFPYCDFNTWYLGAASGTSGGSSGSPVLNVEGNAIALNCGASTTSNAAFYLPLDSVVHALHHIKNGQVVPRGTIQTVFHYKPYNEAVKLGLIEKYEKELRDKYPGCLGVIVVDMVVKDGPADGLLESGDILYQMNGKHVGTFIELETILNDLALVYQESYHVENENIITEQPIVDLEVLRGGELIKTTCVVQDLHSLIPTKFLNIGGAVMHSISLTMAVTSNSSINGVYVSHTGVIFRQMSSNSLLLRINGNLIETIDDVIDELINVPHGHFFTIQFRHIQKEHEIRFAEGRNERALTSFNMFERNIYQDIINTTNHYSPWKRKVFEVDHIPPPPLIRGLSEFAARKRQPSKKKWYSSDLKKYAHAMVQILSEDALHFAIDGAGVRSRMEGVGVIIDAHLGLVLTARTVLRTFMSNITIVIAGVVRVPAVVYYLHPCHNWGICKYDISILESKVKEMIIDVPICHEMPLPESSCVFISTLFEGNTQSIDCNLGWPIPHSSILSVGTSIFNVVDLNWLVDETLKRGLVFCKGRLVGLRCHQKLPEEDAENFIDINIAIDCKLIQNIVQLDALGRPLRERWLEVELGTMELGEARRILRLSDEWLNRFTEEHEKVKSSLSDTTITALGILFVARSMLQTDCAIKLQRGDIILEVENKIVHQIQQVEELVRYKPLVKIKLFRNGEIVEVTVKTERLDRYYHPLHVIEWAGCSMINTETAVRMLGRMPPSLLVQSTLAAPQITSALAINEKANYSPTSQNELIDNVRGVFVSIVYTGSPSAVLEAGCWILAINNIPVLSLDDVLRVVTRIPDNSDVRVTIYSYTEAREKVATLRTNEIFWPTVEFMLDETKHYWNRREWRVPYGESLEIRTPISLANAQKVGQSRDSLLSQDNLLEHVHKKIPHISCRPYHFSHYVYPSDEQWSQEHRLNVSKQVWNAFINSMVPFIEIMNDHDENDATHHLSWWNEEFLPSYLQEKNLQKVRRMSTYVIKVSLSALAGYLVWKKHGSSLLSLIRKLPSPKFYTRSVKSE